MGVEYAVVRKGGAIVYRRHNPMNDKEKGVMALYRETRPADYIGEPSSTNHLAWSLLVLALGLIFWLLITLSNTENQRYAL